MTISRLLLHSFQNTYKSSGSLGRVIKLLNYQQTLKEKKKARPQLFLGLPINNQRRKKASQRDRIGKQLDVCLSFFQVLFLRTWSGVACEERRKRVPQVCQWSLKDEIWRASPSARRTGTHDPQSREKTSTGYAELHPGPIGQLCPSASPQNQSSCYLTIDQSYFETSLGHTYHNPINFKTFF